MKQVFNSVHFNPADKRPQRYGAHTNVFLPRHSSERVCTKLDRDRDVTPDYRASGKVWIIASGMLRIQHHNMEGRRQILSLALPGEIVGCERGLRDGINVETATPCCLCAIERQTFDSLLRRSSVFRVAVCRQQQNQLDRLRWLTWAISALRPDERFCAFLAIATRLMPCQPLPDGTAALSIQLSRPDIADTLATTVETISRASHKLAQSGVIEIKDSRHFRILDLPGLIRLGRIGHVFDSLPLHQDGRHQILMALGLGGAGLVAV